MLLLCAFCWYLMIWFCPFKRNESVVRKGESDTLEEENAPFPKAKKANNNIQRNRIIPFCHRCQGRSIRAYAISAPWKKNNFVDSKSEIKNFLEAATFKAPANSLDCLEFAYLLLPLPSVCHVGIFTFLPLLFCIDSGNTVFFVKACMQAAFQGCLGMMTLPEAGGCPLR